MSPPNSQYRMCKKDKRRNPDAPPYCQKEFPVIPPVDECLPVPLNLEVSDASRIMYFMENFNGISSQELEFDINTYLKEMCQASDVFIIHIIRASQQGRVRLLTDRVLEEEIIMPLSRKTINSIIKWDGQDYVCAKEFHPELRKICRKVMQRKGDQIHVIPILCRCRRDKDETLRIYGNPIAIVCLLNCEKVDFYILRATQELFRYCTTTLLNTMEGEEEARLKRNCHLLLEGSKNLFKNIHDLDQLVKEIMLCARHMTDAERCSIFLMDPEQLHLISRVFNPDPAEGLLEVRIAIDQAIPAHVAATGKILNIPNAYEHPLFFKGEDIATGVKTRNILCFPIRDERELLIGVGMLSNKKNGEFDIFDEQMVEEFAINCGIAFMHSVLFRKMEDCVARTRMAQEMMIHKVRVTKEDVAQVLCCKTVHRIPYFEEFEFMTRSIITPEIVCYILRIFDDLDYLRKFKIRDTALIKFFLTVKDVYRENPYRNIHHGFATGHFVYCLLKHLKLVDKRYIAPLEGLALLIAGFCHDMDHSGSANPYLLNTKSTLANYFTSENCVKARHSLNQTLTILTLEGCNILEGLNDTDYNICIELIKDLTLSTDLSVHLKIQYRQKQICTEFYQNSNSAHRYYLCSLIMSASDFSDFVKDWENMKRVSWYLLEEYFKYGDLEKLKGREPMQDIDRERAEVPKIIVDFLEEICVPIFNMVTTLFPDTEDLKTNLKNNIDMWKRLVEFFKEQEQNDMPWSELLLSEALNEEVERIIEEMNAPPQEEEDEEVE